jgi:hypothetical protein
MSNYTAAVVWMMHRSRLTRRVLQLHTDPLIPAVPHMVRVHVRLVTLFADINGSTDRGRHSSRHIGARCCGGSGLEGRFRRRHGLLGWGYGHRTGEPRTRRWHVARHRCRLHCVHGNHRQSGRWKHRQLWHNGRQDPLPWHMHPHQVATGVGGGHVVMQRITRGWQCQRGLEMMQK